MQTSRNEHSYCRFAFTERESGFCSAEFAEKTQDDRFGSVLANGFQRAKELIHLKAPRRGFVSRWTRGREVKRRLQRDLRLIPAEEDGSFA